MEDREIVLTTELISSVLSGGVVMGIWSLRSQESSPSIMCDKTDLFENKKLGMNLLPRRLKLKLIFFQQFDRALNHAK